MGGGLDTNSFFNCLDLYHTPPDSDERQYKSRTCHRQFDPAPRAGEKHGADLASRKRERARESEYVCV